MERRKFLTGSGMVAAAVAGVVLGYRQYNNKPVVDKRVLDEVDSGNQTLVLMQGYGKKEVKPVESSEESGEYGVYYIYNQADSYDKMVQVGIKPGPDGNLYVKTNGEWKQVLTS